ncbi:MAG: calcineurin-like phosphoesterase C-terminal domain-containing protein, partial [Armatimonadota bacterium]
TCGAWWHGEVDEHGVPASSCRDNVPNGHLEVSFDGGDYSIEFVPARRPRSHQMIVWAPLVVDGAQFPVYANVFLGNERSTVEMRVEDGEWTTMERVREPREEHVEMLRADREAMLEDVGRGDQAEQVSLPVESTHLWFAEAALDLDPGYHSVEVRTTDMFGQTYHGERTIRVQ